MQHDLTPFDATKLNFVRLNIQIIRSQLLDGLNANAFNSIFIDRLRVGAIALERHDPHIQIEDLGFVVVQTTPNNPSV